MADIKKEVEAILFSAGRVVLMKELQSLLGLKDPGLIREAVNELKREYEDNESPQMIVEEDDGFKLTVREKFLPLVQKINPHTELSKTMLETLAVITWKQPIVQSDVIKIRTNKAYDHIAELERMGFISKERFGRSYKIKVTQKFLDYFDLPNTDAIKEVFKGFKDVEVAVKKKAGKLEKAASESRGETPEGSGEEVQEMPEQDVSDELEPYMDVLPEKDKPKKETELEVYDVPEGQQEEESDEEHEEGEEGGAEGEASEEDESEEESAEEKAKRLAEEVLEEHGEHEEQEEEKAEERKLHPQLEEFIAKHADEVTPKPTEEHEVPEHEEDEAEEEQGEDESEEDEEPAEHQDDSEGSEGHVPEDDHEDEPLPAEEYPGQFSEETEDSDEDEEEKKK